MDNVNKPLLLIIDDDPVIRDSTQFVLQDEYQVVTAESRNEARTLLDELPQPPDLCLLDLGLPPNIHSPEEGFDLIGDLLAASPLIKILILSGQDDRHNVRRGLTLGAFDFISKPCDIELLRDRLAHALLIKFAEYSQEQPVIQLDHGVLGEAAVVDNMRAQIDQFAGTPFSVLVEGESGSGKELVCRGLHDASPRRGHPYLVLNCAAISSQLIEAQLFGYAKGAFTGASTARAGFFEDVGEGTLCLDEIGEMPRDLQAKLLRVLENGEFYRLGETRVRQSAARVIAATNRDLSQEVANGRFREDLFHRLSVFRIQVPPLRDRGEDRHLLARHFANFYSKELKSQPFQFDTEASAAWSEYPFPGNVRELKNIVIRLCTRYPGQRVDVYNLRDEFETEDPQPAANSTPDTTLPPPSEIAEDSLGLRQAASAQLLRQPDFNLDDQLKLWEQQYIAAALDETGGNLSKAAKLLGVNRTTLYSRIQKFEKP